MGNNIIEKLSSHIFATGQMVRESVRAEMRHCHRVANYTILHAETLRFIHSHKNATMRELANFLHITPPSVTSLINHLIVDKLIARTADKHDRRIVRLVLTVKGKTLHAKRIKIVSRVMRKNLSALNITDQKNLIKILDKIATKINSK